MTKIHFAAIVLAAIVSFGSALDFFAEPDYLGTNCIIDSPIGECVTVPLVCNGDVSSVRPKDGLFCTLYMGNFCSGYGLEIFGPSPTLPGFDNLARSAGCWNM